MEDMTREAYWAEVRSLAETILSETRDHFDGVDWEESLRSALHETIDEHQWIIYTHRNREVLVHASDPDAFTDEFGYVPTIDGAMTLIDWAQLAYQALYNDVSNQLHAIGAWDEPEVPA